MPQRTIARREDDTPPPARGSVIGDNLPSLAGDAERLFDEMLAEREGFNDRVEALVDAGKRADALQIEDMDEGTMWDALEYWTKAPPVGLAIPSCRSAP